ARRGAGRASRRSRGPERRSLAAHRGHAGHRVGNAPGDHPSPRLPEDAVGPRALIWLAGAALCAAACDRPAGTSRRGGPGDVLLRGGWIVDGSGNPRYRGDLLIRGDRADAEGRPQSAAARETLDVSGKVVAPGFIDMLGQSEQNVLIDNRVLSKITQGVTTEVTGEGGSAFPLTDSLVAQDSDLMKKYHFAEDWRDLDGYFRHLEK